MGGKSKSSPQQPVTGPAPPTLKSEPVAINAAAQSRSPQDDGAVGDKSAKAANIASVVAADDTNRNRWYRPKDAGSAMGPVQGLKTSSVLTG